MPIQTKIVLIYVIIICAALLTVYQFENHIFASDSLIKFNTPIAEAWLREDPQYWKTIKVFASFESFAQLICPGEINFICYRRSAIGNLCNLFYWKF